MKKNSSNKNNKSGESLGVRVKKDLKRNYSAYLLVLPVLVFYGVFAYKPMYGAIIAFKDFSPRLGILDSPWTDLYGLKHFLSFFQSYYFGRILKNTLVISFSTLIFSFPAPIILALLLNEVRNRRFKKAVQTISYLPHFISLVVVCSLITMFTSHNGMIVDFLSVFGFETNMDLLNNKKLFVPIYVISDIWQKIGWDSIIYIAALAGIDQEQYEAARIDGANKWKQMLHVTLPGIAGTIILLFILRIGQIMNVGHEKIILLYNDGILETADVISSFVYRRGILEGNWSFSAAVGLFNSSINFSLVILANKISKKFSGTGLW